MPADLQLSLPFACLDFPGRDTVSVAEISAKLGVTGQHVLDHIDVGRLVVADTALIASRRNPRVPIDEYRRWVLSMLTAPARRTFFAELPPEQLRAMFLELHALLFPAAPAPQVEALSGSLVTNRAAQPGSPATAQAGRPAPGGQQAASV